MKVAVYAIELTPPKLEHLDALLDLLHEFEIEAILFEELQSYEKVKSNYSFFTKGDALEGIEMLISLGGDGTILSTIEIIKSKSIPVLGINTGRLGFLSHISIKQMRPAIKQLKTGKLLIEERSLIGIEEPHQLFETNFGLNEITVHKKDTSSMVTIHAYIEDEYFSTYWADGLIISTPTGSTGYSLSCGGPIIAPGSKTFILTPIAPHNLNVRPLIIPDHKTIRLQFEGRTDQFLVSLDSKNTTLDAGSSIVIKKSKEKFFLASLKNHRFSQTLRDKLFWSIDKRNK